MASGTRGVSSPRCSTPSAGCRFAPSPTPRGSYGPPSGGGRLTPTGAVSSAVPASGAIAARSSSEGDGGSSLPGDRCSGVPPRFCQFWGQSHLSTVGVPPRPPMCGTDPPIRAGAARSRAAGLETRGPDRASPEAQRILGSVPPITVGEPRPPMCGTDPPFATTDVWDRLPMPNSTPVEISLALLYKRRYNDGVSSRRSP